jgi:hypothetical protein
VDWGRTPEAHEGRWAQVMAVRKKGEGAALLTRTFDETCVVPVEPGRRYRLSAWYVADTAPRFTLLARGAHGWQVWTESVPLPPAGRWMEATWETSPVPQDVTGVAVGLGVLAQGALRVDGLRMVAVEQQAPPVLLQVRSEATP